jgi:hypothetical protein
MPDHDQTELLIRPRVAELRYGLAAASWRRKALRGEIRTHKLGRAVLIPISEIERVLRDGERPAGGIGERSEAGDRL